MCIDTLLDLWLPQTWAVDNGGDSGQQQQMKWASVGSTFYFVRYNDCAPNRIF
jgi:hypothetical protein